MANCKQLTHLPFKQLLDDRLAAGCVIMLVFLMCLLTNYKLPKVETVAIQCEDDAHVIGCLMPKMS